MMFGILAEPVHVVVLQRFCFDVLQPVSELLICYRVLPCACSADCDRNSRWGGRGRKSSPHWTRRLFRTWCGVDGSSVEHGCGADSRISRSGHVRTQLLPTEYVYALCGWNGWPCTVGTVSSYSCFGSIAVQTVPEIQIFEIFVACCVQMGEDFVTVVFWIQAQELPKACVHTIHIVRLLTNAYKTGQERKQSQALVAVKDTRTWLFNACLCGLVSRGNHRWRADCRAASKFGCYWDGFCVRKFLQKGSLSKSKDFVFLQSPTNCKRARGLSLWWETKIERPSWLMQGQYVKCKKFGECRFLSLKTLGWLVGSWMCDVFFWQYIHAHAIANTMQFCHFEKLTKREPQMGFEAVTEGTSCSSPCRAC